MMRTTMLFIGILLNAMLAFAGSGESETKILVLATPHLSQIEGFESHMLDDMLEKLAAMDFDAVCVEQMPAQLLSDIRSRQDSAYDDVLTYFGGKRLSMGEQVQEVLGISRLEALKQIGYIMQHGPFSEEDHQDLVFLFLAAGDMASAQLHYTSLEDPAALKTAGNLSSFINEFEDAASAANEVYSLGIPLARKLGLGLLESVDDFQDEALLLKYYPDFFMEFMDHQEYFSGVSDHPVFQRVSEMSGRCVEEGNLMELYTYMNGPEYGVLDREAQWLVWFGAGFESGADKARYHLWEMRNMRISANILQTASRYPGGSILVIIGASHKIYLEKYLSQSDGIRLLKLRP